MLYGSSVNWSGSRLTSICDFVLYQCADTGYDDLGRLNAFTVTSGNAIGELAKAGAKEGAWQFVKRAIENFSRTPLGKFSGLTLSVKEAYEAALARVATTATVAQLFEYTACHVVPSSGGISGMGFGVADLVITFLLKITARAFLYFLSIRWKRTTAVMLDKTILKPFLGCPSVKLSYRFDLNGHRIESWSKVPILTMYDAKIYADSISPNTQRVIRVKPQNPERTLFFELDQ